MKYSWFCLRRAFWIGFLKLVCGRAFCDEVLYTCLFGRSILASNRGYILFEDRTWMIKNAYLEAGVDEGEDDMLREQLGIQ